MPGVGIHRSFPSLRSCAPGEGGCPDTTTTATTTTTPVPGTFCTALHIEGREGENFQQVNGDFEGIGSYAGRLVFRLYICLVALIVTLAAVALGVFRMMPSPVLVLVLAFLSFVCVWLFVRRTTCARA